MFHCGDSFHPLPLCFHDSATYVFSSLLPIFSFSSFNRLGAGERITWPCMEAKGPLPCTSTVWTKYIPDWSSNNQPFQPNWKFTVLQSPSEILYSGQIWLLPLVWFLSQLFKIGSMDFSYKNDNLPPSDPYFTMIIFIHFKQTKIDSESDYIINILKLN